MGGGGYTGRLWVRKFWGLHAGGLGVGGPGR